MRYAISDIHGCFKTFRRLIESGIKMEKNDQLFLMGDYIDRGPSSKQVLDYILYLMENNYNVVLLRGNHEEIFLNVIDGKHDVSLWYYNGGLETLHDFGFTKFIDRKELIDQF